MTHHISIILAGILLSAPLTAQNRWTLSLKRGNASLATTAWLSTQEVIVENWNPVLLVTQTSPLAGATIGINIWRFTIYGGIEGMASSREQSREQVFHNTDLQTGELYLAYLETYNSRTVRKLLIPQIGIRFNFGVLPKRIYLMMEASKTLPYLENGWEVKRTNYNPDGTIKSVTNNQNKLDGKDLKEALDGLDPIGLMGGIGAEVEFIKGFSIGGEFGYRYLLNSSSWHSESTNNNSAGDIISRELDTVQNDNTLGETFTRFVLNFHF